MFPIIIGTHSNTGIIPITPVTSSESSFEIAFLLVNEFHRTCSNT